jgi:hypothetical protein
VTGLGIIGAQVTLQPGNLHFTTVSGGFYGFADLTAGTYTVSVGGVAGYQIAPASQGATVGPSALSVNFTATATTSEITYSNRIKAILDARCIECHGPDLAQSNVRLDSYSRVDGNDAYNNAEAALASILNNTMPDGGPPMPLVEKESIDDWISVWNKAE